MGLTSTHGETDCWVTWESQHTGVIACMHIHNAGWLLHWWCIICMHSRPFSCQRESIPDAAYPAAAPKGMTACMQSSENEVLRAQELICPGTNMLRDSYAKAVICQSESLPQQHPREWLHARQDKNIACARTQLSREWNVKAGAYPKEWLHATRRGGGGGGIAQEHAPSSSWAGQQYY